MDVIVGGETGGIPLAPAVSLAGGLPFAFVRKPGCVGHDDLALSSRRGDANLAEGLVPPTVRGLTYN